MIEFYAAKDAGPLVKRPTASDVIRLAVECLHRACFPEGRLD